jgi:hypothetical protein
MPAKKKNGVRFSHDGSFMAVVLRKKYKDSVGVIYICCMHIYVYARVCDSH